MDYFNILQLKKEPFSNSPDPEFFFQSSRHLECLQKIELALRLKRGLNIIIGDIGTGKTTLCRHLIGMFANSSQFETHLVLDPYFVNPTEFLKTVSKMMQGNKSPDDFSDWQIKESIKNYLFQNGVEENKTIILIIDEGQKIPGFCLEILREFLNYETNAFKLLQIVIFAQKEFKNTLNKHENFVDRINLYHVLKPLTFRDTRSMIKYRLDVSSEQYQAYTFFTLPALWAIYLFTKGYPRKIIHLCHNCILTMIVQNHTSIGFFLVRSCVHRIFPGRKTMLKSLSFTAAIFLIALSLAYTLMTFNQLKATRPQKNMDLSRLKTESTYSADLSPVSINVHKSTAASRIGPAGILKTDPYVPKQPDINYPFPETLGRLTLIRNDTLSGLITKIYGGFSSNHLKNFILVNPGIENPDLVKVGQTVVIPAIRRQIKPLFRKVSWIIIDEKKYLQEAYQSLKSLPSGNPGIRLLPYWNSRVGTRFALIIDRYYLSESTALSQLKRLSPDISVSGRVVSKWDEDTVFFSDPFFPGLAKK